MRFFLSDSELVSESAKHNRSHHPPCLMVREHPGEGPLISLTSFLRSKGSPCLAPPTTCVRPHRVLRFVSHDESQEDVQAQKETSRF